jgi:hypothetical protein
VTHSIRSRAAGALPVLAVLLGLLGPGVTAAQPAAGQPPDRGVAATPPLHAGQPVVRDQDAARRAMAERGRRDGPAHAGALLAMLAGALVAAARWPRSGARRLAGAAGARGRPRRTWCRAPPRRLQPA